MGHPTPGRALKTLPRRSGAFRGPSGAIERAAELQDTVAGTIVIRNAAALLKKFLLSMRAGQFQSVRLREAFSRPGTSGHRAEGVPRRFARQRVFSKRFNAAGSSRSDISHPLWFNQLSRGFEPADLVE
jgi:hypothetical protein